MTAPEKPRACIIGTGSFLPENIVKNADLEKKMDTSDEWIRQRSGIEERRFVTPGTPASDLALKAAEKALKSAALTAKDLDLIIVASLSPEHYFPGTCSFLQRKLGLTSTPAFDLRAQCSGFIYGLNLCQSLIESEAYKTILLVGVEIQSVALDMSDRGRDMAVLFGDGAGAVVLQAKKNTTSGIVCSKIHSQGEHAEKLWVEFPSTLTMPIVTAKEVDEGRIHPRMDGKFVFKHAVTRLPEIVKEVLHQAKKNIEEIDFFLFHQANLRINEFVGESLKIPPAKTFNNIQKYGNTSAASIPILLDECLESGKIKKGDVICMAAFGAGFTWGAAVVEI